MLKSGSENMYKASLKLSSIGSSHQKFVCKRVPAFLRSEHIAPRRCLHISKAFQMDRRTHLENAWRQQSERDERLSKIDHDISNGSTKQIIKVDDLNQLEAILEKAGSSLVVVFLFSRTCGVCKEALKQIEAMCETAAAAGGGGARVLFLKHDIMNEYDFFSDVARFYQVKVVPTVLFIDEGAVVKRLTMRDLRSIGGSKAWIQHVLTQDKQRLDAAYQQMTQRRSDLPK